MTQQDKQLLITDLCARLPYGVKGIDTRYDKQGSFHAITGLSYIPVFGYSINFDSGDNSYLEHNSFKPILFPLSAINQEIEVNGEKVCVRRNIEDIQLAIDETGDLDMTDIWFINPNEYIRVSDTLHRYHIDYRNLIGKGLAISVFDLPENPYK